MTDLPALSFNLSSRPRRHRVDLSDPALFRSIIARRIVAEIVDWAIICALVAILLTVLALTTVFSFGLLTFPAAMVTLAAPLLYHLYFAVAQNGRTIGKLLLWLEIRAIDGTLPSAELVLLRTVLFYACNTVLTPLILLVCLFSDRRRGLHDFLSGTLVINAPELRRR